MSFLNTLSESDRAALRRSVKVTHMNFFPKEYLTNYEADKMIEAIGPEVAGRMIRVAKDSGIMEM